MPTQVGRLEKELKARDAKIAKQAETISGLRVELSELGLNAQVAIDDLREDLQKSEERLKTSQVKKEHPTFLTPNWRSYNAQSQTFSAHVHHVDDV